MRLTIYFYFVVALAGAHAQSSTGNSTASMSAASATSEASASESASSSETVSGNATSAQSTSASSSAAQASQSASTGSASNSTDSGGSGSLTGTSGYILTPVYSANQPVAIPSIQPDASILPIVQTISTPHNFTEGVTSQIKGHFVTAPDASMFSIYPPIQGCGYGLTTTSAEARYRGCAIAMNFGFFDISNKTHPHCLGAVVSDGYYVENDTTDTIHFGLTSDGQWFIGYVDNEFLQQHTINTTDRCDSTGPCKNPNKTSGGDWYFKSLASGQVQLVNDGQNFVNQSGTASGQNFITELSARAAIGVLQDGKLGLVQVDGRSGVDGTDLNTFADLLVKMGFKYAVNMDGGGSSTTALNGVLASSPSDLCPGDEQRLFGCERNISTIACIHSSPQAFYVGAI